MVSWSGFTRFSLGHPLPERIITMDWQRRQFLRGGSPVKPEPIRPPWIKEPVLFAELCTQCEACIKACPTAVLIKGDGGYPEINFSDDGCTFCAYCAKACPEPLFFEDTSRTAWNQTASLGNACLAIQGIACQCCQDACESRAITFQLNIGKPATPVLAKDDCTGCGACVSSCPNNAITISVQKENNTCL